MINFSINYNPYKGKTVYLKDGNKLTTSSRLNIQSGEILQSLFSASYNWKGLVPEIVDECADTQINITFKGRECDYLDFEAIVNEYLRWNPSVSIRCSFISGTNDDDILSKLDIVIDDIRRAGDSDFYTKNAFGENPFEAYEKIRNGEFCISVVGTMSSGKSTLINSLIGEELLPSLNEATTATVARIIDDVSNRKVMKAIGYDNEVKYPEQPINPDLIKQINNDPEVKFIDIYTRLPDLSSSKFNIRIYDTPGPDNSRDERHGILTREIISTTKSIVLYVMNAQKQADTGDKTFLQFVSEEMKKYDKKTRDRFIFVINKCDSLDYDKGETIEKLIETTQNYLKEFDINDPIIVPMSAFYSLLCLKEKTGAPMTRKERSEISKLSYFNEFSDMHYETFARISPSLKEKLFKESNESNTLLHCGLTVVENVILDYVEKYAYPDTIRKSISDIVTVLNRTKATVMAPARLLASKYSLEKSEQEIEKLNELCSSGTDLENKFNEKIDEFSLDNYIDKDVYLKKVNDDLIDASTPYLTMKEIPQSKANETITEFVEKLNTLQREVKENLDTAIQANLFREGKEMMSDFKTCIAQHFDNISVLDYNTFAEEFNFASSELCLEGLDELIQANSKHVSECRWVDNPRRHWWTFWRPKQIRQVTREGDFTNIKEIAQQILSELSGQLEDGINNAFGDAISKTEEYKNYFKTNLRNLRDKIDEAAAKLVTLLQDRERLESEVKANTEKAEWVRGIQEKLDNLLGD